MTTGEQRQLEVERLTALFTDAILHAPIPDVNPNLIRSVESQARSCALAVVDDQQEAVEFVRLDGYLSTPATAQCSGCGRSTWDVANVDAACEMPQPDGRRCPGTFVALTPAPSGSDDTKGGEQWRVHVQGPDDLLPAESRLDAMSQAHEINRQSLAVIENTGDDAAYPTVWAVPLHGTKGSE